MKDKKLKEMWKNAEKTMGAQEYQSGSIENFIDSRSLSVTEKVTKMLHLDIGLKLLVSLVLCLDAILFLDTRDVFLVSVMGILVLIPLLLFEFKVIKKIRHISDEGQNTKERLTGMLLFLRRDFFTALLAVSSTYIFIFIAGMILYFFASYGYVRSLDGQDIFVFTVLIIIGIVMNYVVNSGVIKYQIKHLELCLTDLNENSMEKVQQDLDREQNRDRTINLLLGLVIIFGFVLLIVLFKGLFN